MVQDRYWLDLDRLKYRHNRLEYGHARTDAINWLDTENVGWFTSAEKMNEYILSEILPRLERVWRENPEWRLGQLLVNAVGNDRDMYYVWDGQIRSGLDKL